MSEGRNLLRLAGNLSVLTYLIFSGIAFAFYPKAFTPMTNWLSDLGNPKVNLSGALFYNAGCILTACMLIVFYFGFRKIAKGKKKAKVLLSIAWLAGICASLALITASTFPLGAFTKIHSTASSVLFFALTYFEAFSATVILIQPEFPKWLGIYGLLTATGTFIFGVLINIYPGEWITIAAFIVYVLLISNSPRFSIKSSLQTVTK